jgi:hypothetical protein
VWRQAPSQARSSKQGLLFLKKKKQKDFIHQAVPVSRARPKG